MVNGSLTNTTASRPPECASHVVAAARAVCGLHSPVSWRSGVSRTQSCRFSASLQTSSSSCPCHISNGRQTELTRRAISNGGDKKAGEAASGHSHMQPEPHQQRNMVTSGTSKHINNSAAGDGGGVACNAVPWAPGAEAKGGGQPGRICSDQASARTSCACEVQETVCRLFNSVLCQRL